MVDIRKLSALMADPNTVFPEFENLDAFLGLDQSEPNATRKIKAAPYELLRDSILAELPPISLAGQIHAIASKTYTAGGQAISTAQPTYTDITNASQDIVTSKTCTIIMLGFQVCAVHTADNTGHIRCSIGGVAGGANGFNDNRFNTQSVLQVRTGVAPGTITCKLQGAPEGSGGTWQVISYQGYILALAISEE